MPVTTWRSCSRRSTGECRHDGQLGYQEVRDIDAGQPPGEPD